MLGGWSLIWKLEFCQSHSLLTVSITYGHLFVPLNLLYYYNQQNIYFGIKLALNA